MWLIDQIFLQKAPAALKYRYERIHKQDYLPCLQRRVSYGHPAAVSARISGLDSVGAVYSCLRPGNQTCPTFAYNIHHFGYLLAGQCLLAGIRNHTRLARFRPLYGYILAVMRSEPEMVQKKASAAVALCAGRDCRRRDISGHNFQRFQLASAGPEPVCQYHDNSNRRHIRRCRCQFSFGDG